MTLRDQMNRDVAALTSPNDFGETVTYYPRGGEPVTFDAVVAREGRTEESGIAYEWAIVDIPVAMVPLVKNGDLLEFAMRIGGEASKHRVDRVVSQDAAFWKVEVTA